MVCIRSSKLSHMAGKIQFMTMTSVRIEQCPLKKICLSPIHTPINYECDLIWKQGLCRCIQELRSYWINAGSKPMIGVFIRDTDTQGGHHYDHISRDWSDVSTDKENQGLLGTTRSQEETKKDLPLKQGWGAGNGASKHGPAETTLFQTSSPENCERINLLFQATQFVVICYGTPKKLIQPEMIIIYLIHFLDDSVLEYSSLWGS